MSKANADYLMQAAMDAGITNHKELANFMGQMQVESGGFNRMEENLNYSTTGLLEHFHGRNGLQTVEQARAITSGGPEAVAEAIYGGSWGRKNLGNIEVGDGYAYRGRGFTQLTGRGKYENTGGNVGLDLAARPDDAADRSNAARIAIATWEQDVVAKGHQQDVYWATRDINKGTNGLVAREAAAAEWERKLDAGYRPGQPDPTVDHSTVDRRQLQTGLNALDYTDARGRPLAVDGRDGPGTRAAIEAFQRDRDLSPDGVAGPRTRAALATALADTQTVSAAASPTGSAAQSAVTSSLSPSVPLSPADQAAIDRGLRYSAGAPVPPSSLSTVLTPPTTPAADGQVASVPTASELWNAVAARAPVASTTAASVVAVPAVGPSLGSR